MKITIDKILAREILDSRGFPTVEAEIRASNGVRSYASVPSGASTGKYEALELRDHDPKRFLGKGVLLACNHINQEIAPLFKGKEIFPHIDFVHEIDRELLMLDNSTNKKNIGSNAALAVSLASAKLCAKVFHHTLVEFLNPTMPKLLPVPMMNIINGGAHADNGLDIQEFMIIPAGMDSFSECLRAGAEVFQHLKSRLHAKNLMTSVGDEGGFSPSLRSHEEAIELILEAIECAGYQIGKDIYLGLDVASSEFYADGYYNFKMQSVSMQREQMVDYLVNLVNQYPIISIEDGMAEEDWAGWQLLTRVLGEKIQLVGDDLFVTNTELLQKGIQEKVANAILIKPNQIGTLTETFAAIDLAKANKYATIISHRSGETEETFIADLAVATNAAQIKTGSLCRTERVAKYNQLLRIEQQLGVSASFAGKRAFPLLYSESDFTSPLMISE